MSRASAEPRHVVVLRELIASTAAVVVAGFPAVLMAESTPGRAVVIAVACGVLAAWCTHWLSRTGIALLGALAFVLIIADQPGMAAAWPYTPAIALAVILGASYRRLTHPAAATGRG